MGHHQYANVHELLNLPAEKIQNLAAADLENAAKIHMRVLKLQSHSDAVDRLTIIAAERRAQPTFLTIAGWPALQRQTLVPRPELGEEEDSAKSSNEPKMLMSVTTAVAVGNSVFRMDGTVAAESTTAKLIAEQIKEIGLGLSFQQSGNPAQAAQEVQKLQSNPSPRTKSPQGPKTISATSNSQALKTISASPKTTSAASASTASQSAGLSLNTTLGGNGTEPEIAVSTDGKNIVIASQAGGVSSQDGG